MTEGKIVGAARVIPPADLMPAAIKEKLLDVCTLMTDAWQMGMKIEFQIKTDEQGVSTLISYKAWQEMKVEK